MGQTDESSGIGMAQLGLNAIADQVHGHHGGNRQGNAEQQRQRRPGLVQQVSQEGFKE